MLNIQDEMKQAQPKILSHFLYIQHTILANLFIQIVFV